MFKAVVIQFILRIKYLFVYTADRVIKVIKLDDFSTVHEEQNVLSFSLFNFRVPKENDSFYAYTKEKSGNVYLKYFLDKTENEINVHKEKIKIFEIDRKG